MPSGLEVRHIEAATAQRPPAALTALVEQLSEPGFASSPQSGEDRSIAGFG